MRALLVLTLLLISLPSQAGGMLSVGMGRGVLAHDPFERFASIGYKTGGELQFKAETGFYLDYENETKMTGFASASGGYELTASDGKYVSAFLGPAAITQKDRKLGSLYQFQIDFGIGLKMDSGKALGLRFIHLSNAGVVQPNIGRDILAVGVQF